MEGTSTGPRHPPAPISMPELKTCSSAWTVYIVESASACPEPTGDSAGLKWSRRLEADELAGGGAGRAFLKISNRNSRGRRPAGLPASRKCAQLHVPWRGSVHNPIMTTAIGRYARGQQNLATLCAGAVEMWLKVKNAMKNVCLSYTDAQRRLIGVRECCGGLPSRAFTLQGSGH